MIIIPKKVAIKAEKVAEADDSVKKQRPKSSKPTVKDEKPVQKNIDDSKLIPEISIVTTGHVDHGKTTLTQALTGKWTDTHSEEMKRGITIKLGYADISFYKCTKCGLSGTTQKCSKCFSDCEILRTISLVDAPGHETLMATVLSGVSIVDGALLVIAANEECPQPQTAEHLSVLDISGIRKIVVVQNKIDLVTPEKAMENYQKIKNFLKGSVAENAPIVPVSAQQRVNIDLLIDTINQTIPTPQRDPSKDPKMLVARSFDINKPGTEISKLSGGILGGSLVQGEFKDGDEIEIRPGIDIKGKYEPIKTKIIALHKGGKILEKAGPGGLLGIQTELDPSLTKADRLSGNVVGHVGKLPPVLDQIVLKTSILKRIVGTKEELNITPIIPGESLMLTVGTSRTVGVVYSVKNKIDLDLKLPVCADKGDRVAISRQINGRWRLIGWGEIV